MVLNDIPSNVWTLGLDRVSAALDRLGHPENAYRHVLVAGTNGKGSTCIYLERLLSVLGFTVGTTISPHVARFTERFRINGADASEEELELIRKQAEPTVGDLGLTYFEWCVILAALLFKDRRVDFGIFEVGLGGRYDASNALDPEACLITGISLDHTDLLGKTIRAIAGEKAAIARVARPLITSATGEASDIIREHASEVGAILYRVEEPVVFPTSIKGTHQPMNAALAVRAIQSLGLNASEDQVRRAVSSAFLPGRIEEVGSRVILDVAHNPAAMSELRKYLDQRGFHGVGVFGVLGDKDYAHMIEILEETCSRLYLAPVRSERSWKMHEMEEFLKEGRVIRCASVSEALHEALSTGEDVIVTGSFYTVGEVRESIVCAG